jgi:hypothetical protein
MQLSGSSRSSARLHISSRDKNSKATPKEFSWKFFIIDNGMRFLTTLLLLFIFLRFPEYLVQIPFVAEHEIIILLTAFGVGLYNDKLAIWLKRINFLGMNNTPVRKQLQNEINRNNPADNGGAGAADEQLQS